jgi:cytochrome c oxidase subunit 1
VLVAASRYPLWLGPLGVVTGLASNELLVTRVVDAEPDHALKAAEPSIMPVITAVATAVLITACLFTPWGLPLGSVLVAIALCAWFWPTDHKAGFDTAQRVREERLAEKKTSP